MDGKRVFLFKKNRECQIWTLYNGRSVIGHKILPVPHPKNKQLMVIYVWGFLAFKYYGNGLWCWLVSYGEKV